MIKEQEEAIEKLEYYLKNSACKRENSDFFKNGGWEVVDLEIPKSIETVLNMLKEKDKEIENLKIGIDEAWEEWNILEQSSYEEEQRLKTKIEEKNRIIDLMAEEIAFYQDINSHEDIKIYKKQIEQYFERRVKNGQRKNRRRIKGYKI